MQFEWDSEKARQNLAKHGVSFESLHDLDWTKSIGLEDTRRDYGESRFILYAPIGERLHALIYTVRDDRIRAVSLRKANSREVQQYERLKATRDSDP